MAVFLGLLKNSVFMLLFTVISAHIHALFTRVLLYQYPILQCLMYPLITIDYHFNVEIISRNRKRFLIYDVFVTILSSEMQLQTGLLDNQIWTLDDKMTRVDSSVVLFVGVCLQCVCVSLVCVRFRSTHQSVPDTCIGCIMMCMYVQTLVCEAVVVFVYVRHLQ